MSWIKWKWLRLRARMVREKKPPEFVARGWAIGMFYGCTIPFGFQLILSIPTAIFLKGSKVGATVGTFITNHFTIFFIYPAQCWAGNLVLRACGRDVMSVEKIYDELMHVGSLSMLSGEFWSALGQLGGGVMASFFIGGALLALVCTPLTYWGVLRTVRSRRARAERRKLERRAKRAENQSLR
ncbi:MAG: DUF2062 domain-containing protein [Kiritimatiellae bacterium]|nr:DUF2062 domain-containing protein [Kiritimatiellia bacterium]